MYENIVLGFEFEVEGRDQDIYNLIDNSEHITALTEHYIQGYHDTRYKTAEGLWRVEEDETIEGAEFISPPENYYKAKKLCKAFFEIIKNTDGIAITNACGLHVGMSVNGNLDSVNLESIIPNINYRLLAKLWPDRMLGNNYYCSNLGHMIKKVNIYGNGLLTRTKSGKPDISFVSKTWLDNAHSFIKTKSYENVEYIEFRAPGGLDYHLKFNELFTSIDHISDILLGHTKLSKKKSVKKMCSYINRIYKNSDYTYFIPPLIPEIFSEYKLPTEAFNNVYGIIIGKLRYITYHPNSSDNEVIRAQLNKDNYLFFMLKYMIANRIISKLNKLSDFINAATVTVSIPENKQQSDMIKMLKLWPKLPRKLVRDLLDKLNQKAYKHFIKYHINNAQNINDSNWMSNICKHELNHTPSL